MCKSILVFMPTHTKSSCVCSAWGGDAGSLRRNGSHRKKASSVGAEFGGKRRGWKFLNPLGRTFRLAQNEEQRNSLAMVRWVSVKAETECLRWLAWGHRAPP